MDVMNGVSYVASSRGLIKIPFESVMKLSGDWIAVMPVAFIDGNTLEVR